MPPAFALSQDQTLRFIPAFPLPGKPKQTDPKLTHSRSTQFAPRKSNSKRRNASKRYINNAPNVHKIRPKPNTYSLPPIPISENEKSRTPPTYPFLAYTYVQRTPRFREPATKVAIGEARFLVGGAVCVNANSARMARSRKIHENA